MIAKLFILAFTIAMICGAVWGGETFANGVIVMGLASVVLGAVAMIGGALLCMVRDIVIGVRYLVKR